jgi:hypothetical protein
MTYRIPPRTAHCCICGHTLPAACLPFAVVSRRRRVVCLPCVEAALDILEDARNMPIKAIGAVVAPLRDNDMASLADFLIGAVPFEVC